MSEVDRRYEQFQTVIARQGRDGQDLKSLVLARLGALTSDMAALPLGVLGYAEVTSSQSGITSLVDVTSISTTVDVGTGRRIRIIFYNSTTTGSVAGDRFSLSVKEGGTSLQNRIHRVVAGSNAEDGFEVVWSGTPSAGSHTYKATIERVAGTGNISLNASGTNPMFILVEDIGPA